MDHTTLKTLNLVFKENDELGLQIIKYKKDHTNMENEFSRKCRGLIVEKSSGNIICMPPIKSLDMDEYLDKFSISESVIEEFIDGTMINMWYYKDNWHISTRSSIGANCKWYSNKKFNELFEESNKLDLDKLDKTMYYSFVLQHPENRIVTCYTEPTITLVFVGSVGSDNKITSMDLEEIGKKLMVPTPNRFIFEELTEFNDLTDFVSQQNFQFQGVVLKNGIYRTKIRNPNYNYARQLRGNTTNLKYLYYDLVKTGKIHEYLNFYPEYIELFNNFNSEFLGMVKEIHRAYMNYHVTKSIKNIKDVYFPFRPHCYNLHAVYLQHRKPITIDTVMGYLNTLEPAQIVYILNYKFYKKNNETTNE